MKRSPVDGNINTDKYVFNFDDHLCYMVAQHFPYRPWIFKEDNAPCHMSARANAYKSINIINTLPRPAQSPDLNIMENVWKHWKFEHWRISENKIPKTWNALRWKRGLQYPFNTFEPYMTAFHIDSKCNTHKKTNSQFLIYNLSRHSFYKRRLCLCFVTDKNLRRAFWDRFTSWNSVEWRPSTYKH